MSEETKQPEKIKKPRPPKMVKVSPDFLAAVSDYLYSLELAGNFSLQRHGICNQLDQLKRL